MCRIYAQTDPILYECRARSVRISGVTTTIRLENLFWQTLSELAAVTGLEAKTVTGAIRALLKEKRIRMYDGAGQPVESAL